MSLTDEDLAQIKNIVNDVVNDAIKGLEDEMRKMREEFKSEIRDLKNELKDFKEWKREMDVWKDETSREIRILFDSVSSRSRRWDAYSTPKLTFRKPYIKKYSISGNKWGY